MKNIKIDKWIAFRHEMHQNPELSGSEFETTKRIKKHIELFNPTEIISFKTGLIAVWDSGNMGKNILFRADIDALPIQEKTDHSYRSNVKEVAHLCGHDGHTSILLGVAEFIFQNAPTTGKIILLFQPAEETGEGAESIVKNTAFQTVKPDYVFGLHNIPGFKENTILLRKNTFACASRGVELKLFGKTSHAGEPENGINPVFAIEKLIHQLYEIPKNDTLFSAFRALTMIHIKLGEIAFGTSPGYAELRMTLRTEKNKDMEILVTQVETLIQTICKEEKLRFEIGYREIFPAVENKEDAFAIVKEATNACCSVQYLENPFRWSEDFAYFSEQISGCFWGVGAGENHPDLHNEDYDFPDQIMETGMNMFIQIYKALNR